MPSEVGFDLKTKNIFFSAPWLSLPFPEMLDGFIDLPKISCFNSDKIYFFWRGYSNELTSSLFTFIILFIFNISLLAERHTKYIDSTPITRGKCTARITRGPHNDSSHSLISLSNFTLSFHSLSSFYTISSHR